MYSPSTERLRQRTFNCPAAGQSRSQCQRGDADLSAPISQRFSFSCILKHPITSSVVGLLDARGPLAILRRIVSVGVSAIQGVLVRWTRPHIIQEVLERLRPSLAHSDSSATIVRMFRFAAAFHGCPDSKLSRLTFAMRNRFFTEFDAHFMMKTSARFRCRMQRILLDMFHGAAIASAQPKSPWSFTLPAVSVFADDRQPTESLAY